MFLASLPIYAVMTHGQSAFGWLDVMALDVMALVVTLGAILVETVADLQLHAFIARNKQPGGFVTSGLWAWSRHPNYLGEPGIWWGLMLFGLAAAPAQRWWIGAASGAGPATPSTCAACRRCCRGRLGT